MAALNGAFQGRVEQAVNYVNAPVIAAERGIEVTEERSGSVARLHEPRHASRVDDVEVSGTTIGPEHRHFLAGALGFAIDLQLSPRMVFFRYDDVPGVIGRVGTMFGDAGVNIANMAVSRTKQGGKALMALAIDSEPPPELVERIRARGLRRRPLHRARLELVLKQHKLCRRHVRSCAGRAHARAARRTDGASRRRQPRSSAATTPLDALVLVAVREQERRPVGSHALVSLERRCRLGRCSSARRHSQTNLVESSSNCSAVSAIRSLTSRNSDSVLAILGFLGVGTVSSGLGRTDGNADPARLRTDGRLAAVQATWPEPVERVAAFLRKAGAEARLEELESGTADR